MANEFENVVSGITQIRDDCRPDMETVVAVLDRLFAGWAVTADFRPVARGPEQWSWLDATNAANGYERWFVLGRSAMPGTEGYPMLTIRQCTAPRLDAWLTFSQLMIGPNEKAIETSFAMAVANHHGAYEGFRDMIATVIDMTEAARAQSGTPGLDLKKDIN